MRHKLGTLLSRIARDNLLGDSLLVRARTTSFAVLGASASVGLAVLAIALHEDWPLVPGSPPPHPVARRAALGEATALGAVRSPAKVANGASVPGGNATRAPRGARRPPAGAHPGPAPSTGSVTAPTGELVVFPSVRAGPRNGGGSGGSRSIGRAGSHVPRAPEGRPPPTPAQPPPPVASPPAAPAPPPEATVSASPPPTQSYVPPWSNGQGHAYGREDGDYGHGDDGEYGDGHDEGGGYGYGHD